LGWSAGAGQYLRSLFTHTIPGRPNLFDAHYDLLGTYSTGADSAQKQKEKHTVLQWMKAIKNLRDPLSHPSDEDWSFEDAFILLDCARRALLRLALKDEAVRVQELMNELLGRPASANPQKEPLEDRLPASESIVTDFVGRERELARLWEWFDDPISRRWLLAGEGGKGKSAIAFQFGRQVKLRAPEPFQIVLWLSAKRRRFQEGVITTTDADFNDCSSATSCLLRHYGWLEELEFDIERRKSRTLMLLNEFPALVIVDDVDSLEGEGEDAIEFFTLHVPQTKSKVLFTSRRVVFGMANVTTHVSGLTETDAERLISSQADRIGLDSRVFTKDVVREIIRVTEASPLYIGDLLRLLTIMPPEAAARMWQEKGGDEARKYALGRELDMLSSDAQQVLVAACVAPGPVSFPEIEAVTSLGETDVVGALGELQRLFLVPKPRLIEGEQRFEANVNTRMLVRAVLGLSDLYRRVETAHKTIAGRLPRVGRGDVFAIIRQAILHVRNHETGKAEALLLRALEKFPNDSDLHGVLGFVYKCWTPRRTTDARDRFRRAWQLRSPEEQMYRHWSRMEIGEGEWSKAAEAAERGLKFIHESRALLYLAGYARSRLGKEFKAGLHEKAEQELRRAQGLLIRALNAQETPGAFEPSLTNDIYRALVLNLEALGDVQALPDFFDRWFDSCPNSPDARTESDRISRKMGLAPTARVVAKEP
jgi:hypothetical protein